MAESDSVRRGLSKKEGTEKYLPEIRKRFVEKFINEYGETEETALAILEPFLLVIESAQFYGFSDNHSNPYSHIGYANGYLRHYYPLEFLTVMLNINEKDKNKTGDIFAYAKSKDISIVPIRYGKSRAMYSPDKTNNTIYKGLASIKFLNANIAEELLTLSKENTYDAFVDLLVDVYQKTSVNTRQLEILIRLNFFSDFGGNNELLEIYKKFSDGEHQYKKTYVEKTKVKRIEKLKEIEAEVRASDIKRTSSPNETVMFQREVMGYADVKYESLHEYFGVIVDIDTKYSPKLTIYNLQNGEEEIIKMNKKLFKKSGLNKGYMIKNLNIEVKYKKKPDGNGDFIETNEEEPWLIGCVIAATYGGGGNNSENNE
jgi:DNA polymerase-3 subunit alpha